MSESRAEDDVSDVPAEPSPDASSPSGYPDSTGPPGSTGFTARDDEGAADNDEGSAENSDEVSAETSGGVSTDTSPTSSTGDGEADDSDTGGDTSGGASATTPAGATTPPARLIFRITPISLLAVMTVAICVTPVAWFQPWLLALYLLPLGLLVWILRVRTVVTADSITATALGRTRISWDDVRSVKLDERRWVRAVLSSGKEVLLPAVRVRDLPHLAAMSGGRLPDPRAAR